MRNTVWTAALVIFLVGVQIDAVDAKGGGGSHQSAGNSASLLRGNNGDNKKGGRYLAAPLKKLPGKKKPPTLTLKGAASRTTPEKVEAGSENIRRVK